MLQFDPAKRITVVEALAHPYFAGLHVESDEPVANCMFDEAVFNSSSELTATHLRGKKLLFLTSRHYLTTSPSRIDV